MNKKDVYKPETFAFRHFLALLLLLPMSTAAAPRPIDTNGAISIYFENDLFAGTDRYYTNGAKISWTSADLAKFSDTPYVSVLLPLLDRLPFINESGFQRNVAFSIGQNIYTPDDTEAEGRLEGDRPYAGWLYAGLGLIWKNAAVRHAFALDIGVVGSGSLGEETQRLVHEIRDLDVPKGWGNQLHNELGVVATYEATWRWPVHDRRVGLNWELLPHAGFAAGNVAIYANAGAELRVGFNLPDDFGTPTISTAATTSTPVEGAQQAARAQVFDLGLYVFARVDGRGVAHNIFIDGNTFGSSAGADRKWFVGDVSAGASLNFRNTKMTYSVVYRSKEFYGQKEGQLFGSVSISIPL